MSNFTSPGSVSRNSCNPSRNNAELTGTYTPFRPFLQVAIESDEIDPNNTNAQVEEVRYQTITMLPEYRNKSLEELRFEDFIAKRYKVRQPVPGAFTQPTFVSPFASTSGTLVNNSTNNSHAIWRSQYNNNYNEIGTNIQFQPFLDIDCLRNSRAMEVRYQTITLMPEYRDKSVEELRLEDYAAYRKHVRKILTRTNNKIQNLAANSQNIPQGTDFDDFEEHAMIIPLQPLPLQVADSSKALAALDDSKHIVTRLLGRYCNVFVTFSSHLQTDQFIVIRILKTAPVFISGLRLYIRDLCRGSYFRRKLLYSDLNCKPNDCLVFWWSENDEMKVIKIEGNKLKKPTCLSVPKTISGQYQLLGDMCGSVEQLCAFIGDRKKAEPIPWKRTLKRSTSTALPSFDILQGCVPYTELSLICEVRNNKLMPVDIKYSSADDLEKISSGSISPTENSYEDKLCKVCIDSAANVVLIPCGHLSLCYECAIKIKLQSNSSCPICRSTVKSIQKVYFS